jgi:hypothetical protein
LCHTGDEYFANMPGRCCYGYVRPEARHRNDLLLERGKAPELARLYEYSCQDSGVVV